MKRRDFILGTAGASCAPWLLPVLDSTAQSNLEPMPTFYFEEPLQCVAGIRPYRRGSYRLEAETFASHPQKTVVHNYGHGGAGISLSWGIANKVRDIVRDRLRAIPGRDVAVLGSGVIGLTTAAMLVEIGLRVKIYARESWSKTTSYVAGGQWAPSIVDYENLEQFKDVLSFSYSRFSSQIGHGFGVSKMPNYTLRPQPDLDEAISLLPGLIDPPTALSRLPFAHNMGPGLRYTTLLIEPPIFLKRLHDDLHAAKVPFIPCTFSTPRDVLSLNEDIIVNCTGSGARELWDDLDLVPIKGQLALLPPQPELRYLFSRSGHVFPRTDAVVVGGTLEYEFDNDIPDPAACRRLVNTVKSVFGIGPMLALFDEHIDSEKSLKFLAPRKGITK